VNEADAGNCGTQQAQSAHKEASMAKIIEFRVPDSFVKPAKWVPEDQRGKVVEFPAQQKKSA
jgi:hypothetical protein